MNLTHSTLNVYSSVKKDVPVQNIPVWLHVDERYPVGGTLTVTPNKKIPAGTPVSIDKLGGTVTVIDTEGVSTATPVGLLENDVFSDAEGSVANVDIVTKGQVLISRCPAEAAKLAAKLPNITMIAEATE